MLWYMRIGICVPPFCPSGFELAEPVNRSRTPAREKEAARYINVPRRLLGSIFRIVIALFRRSRLPGMMPDRLS
ncbi:hypothetical protein SDC9_45953 [bioreactor metagenome]|uniref:Uncharacterized protein n=1 Tax=bioreactor metagenome TaxID=1076179 RepID=A0A644WAZ5_9ZZZZ